jgi:hypothetical protein
MTPSKNRPESILKKEAIGFSAIIVLSWATELFRLPHFLFNEPSSPNWNRALLRTLVVVGIWIWVHIATKRLIKRLHHLEELLHVCSWCRKVGHNGEWLTTEEYFGSKFDTETSHGICPDCAKKTMDRIGLNSIPANPSQPGST